MMLLSTVSPVDINVGLTQVSNFLGFNLIYQVEMHGVVWNCAGSRPFSEVALTI